MPNDPQVIVSHVEELFTDAHGQRWSPATVRLAWPDHGEVRGPIATIQVVASVRGYMTAGALREAHLSAARDVLAAALRNLSADSG